MTIRRNSRPAFPIGLLMVMTMHAHAHDISAPTVAAGAHRSASAFISTLSPDQRKAALFDFADRERYDWHYVPRRRAGLPLRDMSAGQRSMAFAFLKAGLSDEGYRKAITITRLETVLSRIEAGNPMGRDPQKYFFSFFGRPSKTGTWGWRVEGHHLSLNVTIVKGQLFSTAPRFLGANPATVDHGELAGMRILSVEEDLARTLAASMTPQQLAKTVFSRQPYRDIVTGNAETVSSPDPVGISAAELDRGQHENLIRLIDEYVSTMPPEIARQRMELIRREDLGKIRFGWAGALAPGRPHYYRIQGQRFLIEYDNVQNGANHIHTVWRDFDGDFGRDLLRNHYLAEHQ